MKRKPISSIPIAVNLYWENITLGNAEIKKLFNCGETCAIKYKSFVFDFIAQNNADSENKKILLNEPHRIPTKLSNVQNG